MCHPMSNMHGMPPDISGNYCPMGRDVGMMNPGMILPHGPYKNPQEPHNPMEMQDAMNMNMQMNMQMGMNENHNGPLMGNSFENVNPMLHPNGYMANDFMGTNASNGNMNETYNTVDHRKETNIRHDVAAGERGSINKLGAGGKSKLN
ncbi:uncharacterized protein LOC115564526 [Drosophila navojoa]|uniref:uncharacterized protein LOC115564526 n=1 Tax=Drosophila navojoa TaxID=7232 RepID=UPI0011BD7CF0|nr:uncharacterized protein LOC115564526 [Drosophila navojoa]